MMLQYMTGEFEKHRAITYNVAGNKAVYHHRMMRPMDGCIYVGEPEPDMYGSLYFTLYILYPGMDVAMYLDKTNHWRTDEEIMQRVQNERYDTKENFADSMKKRIAAGEHIRFTEVEFLKHIAPELVDGAWESRKIYAERRAHKESERRAKREAEEAEFVEKENNRSWDVVNNAIGVMRKGGMLVNERVTFYKDWYNSSTYSVINFLMDQYGIKLPIRTRGWINDSLKSVKIENGACVGYNYWKSGRSKGSTAVWDYMKKLLDAINAEGVA